jgi:hypothetical protein
VEQRLKIRPVREAEAVLVFRDDLGLVELVAAEVEEAQRRTVHLPGTVALRERPVHQVPVRRVAARIVMDHGVRQERRCEVHPPLIHEQPALHLVQTVLYEAPVPPVEEGERALVERDPQEAQVVHPRQQEVPLGGEGVVLDRPGHVRRQHGVGLAEPLIDLRQIARDQDVGIEITGPVVSPGLVQVEQEPRLDRGVQLEDRVAERFVGEPRDAEALDEDGGERLVLVTQRRVGPVDDQDVHQAPRILLQEGHGQHPGIRQVVIRDDRAGDPWRAHQTRRILLRAVTAYTT